MSSPIPTADPAFPARWLEVAEGITERFYAEFPEHDERYGERGREYCTHDNAYLVAWLVDALGVAGEASFGRNVAWLSSLLDARGFPMEAFRRNLTLVGDEVTRVRPEDAERIARLVAAAGES